MLTEEKILEAASLTKSMRLDESMYCFSEKKKYDVFVSHSFKDKNYVAGLYKLFKDAGYEAYVDWIDDSQLDRTRVNESIANHIRNVMNSCSSLVFVSTQNTPTSQWCPWELGFGDGKFGKVCILPVMKSSFKGQEYLELYPYLDYLETKSGKMNFFVYDQNDRTKYIWLKGWLNGENPTDQHN